MGFEVWIVIVLLASGLSGWIGYAYAKKDAPKQSDIDAMTAELEEARGQAESVQANVSEHFEQSAMLFGKLAADYREFLDHFESSAQNLGLSEARARELIEQGFQPLLTHEYEGVVAETASEAGAADSDEDTLPEQSEPAATQDLATEEAPSALSTVDEATAIEEELAEIGEVTVELPDDAAEQKPETRDSTDPLNTERQRA
jgi:uncharacterized membrane-anchored protein YhcB (DUF1043 family)